MIGHRAEPLGRRRHVRGRGLVALVARSVSKELEADLPLVDIDADDLQVCGQRAAICTCLVRPLPVVAVTTSSAVHSLAMIVTIADISGRSDSSFSGDS